MQALEAIQSSVEIPVEDVTLHGHLDIPLHAQGLVLFVPGTGGSRHLAHRERVAGYLHDVGFGTLILDLLASEAGEAGFNGRQRFESALLGRRLQGATAWARRQPDVTELLIGYFGAGTSTGAVLAAAADEGSRISAVVTRGGGIGVPADTLKKLRPPTLLIVGSEDPVVAEHLEAWTRLTCEKSIEIIPGASPRFEEPGALDNVAALAACWFGEHLRKNFGQE